MGAGSASGTFPLSRARRRRAFVLGVVTYGAAMSGGKRASSTRRNSHLVRAMRRHSFVPEVFTYSAALSVCVERQQLQCTGHLLSATLRHSLAPDVAIYCAASSVYGSASSTIRPYVSSERCGAPPLGR